MLVAAPARADVPEGWSDPEPVDTLHALLVLVGIPLLLFVLIALAGRTCPPSSAASGSRPARRRSRASGSAARAAAPHELESGSSRGLETTPGARVAAGEFSSGERHEIDRAIRAAEQASRCEFSVFVGDAERRPAGVRRAGCTPRLVAPARSVLVMVDPAARALEVVTGAVVRRNLTDGEVELAVLQMRSAFAEGDLVGGLKRGISSSPSTPARRSPSTRTLTPANSLVTRELGTGPELPGQCHFPG